MDMENRLGLVKYSLQQLVSQLREDDTVAIVVYGTSARVVLYPTNGAQKDVILNAIYSLSPSGSTNAEAGLKIGYKLATQTYNPGRINRIILCSDGVANVGNTSANRILGDVKEYTADGITLTTFGFGMGNFNDVFMEQLADNGDGSYAYIDDSREAQEYFIDGLTGVLQTIAFDTKVQVDFNPDVVARYRLIGYENRAVADEQFRDDSVDAGEINAGHSVTAVYAVQFKQGAAGRIATVQLRWRDADSESAREINGNFNTWNLSTNFEETDPHFKLAVLVSTFGELLRGSPYTGYATLDSLVPYAYQLSEGLRYKPEVTELAAYIQRASLLSR
jgi:Ca-activated chloride channel family protein